MFNVHVNATAVISRFGAMPAKTMSELEKAVQISADDLTNYIKQDKLSGQVLNVGPNTPPHLHLRSSIFNTVTSIDNGVKATVATGNVPYAAIHEFGGTINHPGGTAYFVDKATGQPFFVSNAFALESDHFPRTKPHQIHMPERSYMRSGLKDKTEEIVERMEMAVLKGVGAVH